MSFPNLLLPLTISELEPGILDNLQYNTPTVYMNLNILNVVIICVLCGIVILIFTDIWHLTVQITATRTTK